MDKTCCHCGKKIDGASYVSGGVHWHTYSCLNTLTFDGPVAFTIYGNVLPPNAPPALQVTADQIARQ